MTTSKPNRRAFLKMTAGAIVASPSIILTQQAFGQQAQLLAEDDPAAIALGYKLRTTDVDKVKYPSHRDDQVCKNCILYQSSNPEWAGCGAFGGKLVAGQGWCQAYAPKAL